VEADLEGRLAQLAPRPQSLAATGLSQSFVADLLSKQLHEGGTLSLHTLVKRLALSGKIIESVLNFMRKEARVEVLAGPNSEPGLQYRLTDRGRVNALDALGRSNYVGRAPVPLQAYSETVRAQSVHERFITQSAMRTAFEDIVLPADLVDRLGSSLNSGRPIFVYGPAGTGKSYIARKLARMFHDRVMIPYAISVNETVIEVFDPVAHEAIGLTDSRPEFSLEGGFDPRYVCCARPVVAAGGELTADMLEVQYDTATREIRAPLQLKANNGLFLIDDMGRQKVPPETIFNRWIIPMEEKLDYLSLGGGRHFSVPFDVVLIFSTNLHPLDLADEAFLRRIGYKIEFDYLTPDEYRAIWKVACQDYGILYDADVLEFALTELHQKESVRLLPCHPRDLLGIARDLTTYLDLPKRVTAEHLRWAWKNYFVSYSNKAAPVVDFPARR
jgi:predicted ATPase with chaperone activity